jgi:hypothetical protein
MGQQFCWNPTVQLILLGHLTHHSHLGEGSMQNASSSLLAERLAQCEELAEHARDRSVREKARELARGYRELIAQSEHASTTWPGIAAASMPRSIGVEPMDKSAALRQTNGGDGVAR